jgi:hypothetical protein
MKTNNSVFPKQLMIFISALVVFLFVTNQDTLGQNKFPNAKENHKCFKCHGQKTFTFFNSVIDKEVSKRMNPYYVIDTVAFYKGNHHAFTCTDCHDYGYTKFPHNGQLQMQPMPGCLDCHEGDETTAKYHFTEISKEFEESVHAKKYGNDFNCYMCHNPHTYEVTARRASDISKVIIYDNEICLSCHSEVANLTPLSDYADKNIGTIHEWLPNQILHFQNVRCIDCHVEVQNDSMVDHKILPKSMAVRNCVACHSKDTRLMASLYKFQSRELRSKDGFLNAIILNNSFVISANRNNFLNVTSLIILGLIVVVIIIHTILRITRK